MQQMLMVRALEHEQEIIMSLSDILAEILVLESTF